jgi:hypothetical protein
MEKTMKNDRHSDREGFRCTHVGAYRVGAAALLFVSFFVFNSVPAQAASKQILSGECKGPMPDIFACRGTMKCDNDGVYMCCTTNDKGGQDCEAMELKASKQLRGGMRVPSGELQVAPGTTAPTTKVPKTGITTAPIMRRGVEGEQGTESPSGTASPGEAQPASK